MKNIAIFSVVVIASVALLQPAEGRPKGGGHTFSPSQHYSASPGRFSSRPGGYSGGGARYYRSSPRFSSPAAYRNRAYSPSGPRSTVNRSTALNPRAYSTSRSRIADNRRTILRSQGFNEQGRVVTQSSRGWDRGRDHLWHGHRCRWRNNAWVIIDPWFYPWSLGYGYYPYGAYSYYDNGYYDAVYVPAEYSDYDNGDSSVSEVQSALARKGYYRGAIDGSLGPATRNALRQYQRNHGLDVTGRIDRPVLEALGLG